MKRKNEGITLVALIITIIVLIILAGVTISMVVGNDGIITKAKEASQNMSNATSEEKELLQNMLNTMNEIESGIGGNEPEKPDNPNIKEYHNGVPIPKGFYYVGGEAETGLVISDHPDDEKAAVKAGQTGDITVGLVGNQFVWIPVKVEETDTETDIKAFKRTTTYDGTITSPDSYYTEPYSGITSADETGEAEYADMYKSVYEYHGFYVGRYEAGCEIERTDSNKATVQGETNPVLVQKDKFVYNYLPWGASMTSTAPNSEGIIGAVELSRGMYPKTSEEYGVTSALIYGVQWDAIMTFVNDAEHDVNGSKSWGNYYDYTGGGIYEKGKLQKTGANENWKAKNMYDLAGNAWELTNEAFGTNYRVCRGGCFDNGGSYNPASYRDHINPAYANGVHRTFRPMLYVKLDAI